MLDVALTTNPRRAPPGAASPVTLPPPKRCARYRHTLPAGAVGLAALPVQVASASPTPVAALKSTCVAPRSAGARPGRLYAARFSVPADLNPNTPVTVVPLGIAFA